MIYLDNSATTRTLDIAADTARRYMLEQFFNPSSAYSPAVAVERDVNAARTRLAKDLGAIAEEIVFTSGGTESNNMAMMGTLKASRGRGRVIISAVEHSSVYETAMVLKRSGYDIAIAGVDDNGCVDINQLAQLVNGDTMLVCIMQVNNETGAINDMSAIYKAVKSRNPYALVHVDGIQAFAKMPFGPVSCDTYSISGHKFHAPKGVGALYVKKGTRFTGGQTGGGQERNLRSGTTNTPGIMAMDAALSFYRENHQIILETMYACKMRLARNLMQISDVIINGPDIMRGIPHILNASFYGVKGEVLLHALEERGIYVSTGSACSSHKKGKNRVLEAMGVRGERQEGAIRFSLCPFNTIEEMDAAADEIRRQLTVLRRFKRR